MRALPDGGVRLHAPAKINLNLLVGPARADGFHPLDSYVVKVTLYDRIDIHPRRDGRVALTCAGIDCGRVEDNLALRAAERLAQASPAGVGGADIHLVKNIPPGAGLGGGSSDAAAVLGALTGLWELDLTGDDLSGLAAELGSDVPLFLAGPAVRMTGRGEHIAEVKLTPLLAVIYLPEESCPTADVYRQFDRQSPLEPSAPTARQLPATELASWGPSAWRDRLVNDLAAAASAVCPALGRQQRRLQRAVDIPVCLTGSGSALFILCDDEAEARHVLHAVDDDMKPRCRLVCTDPW